VILQEKTTSWVIRLFPFPPLNQGIQTLKLHFLWVSEGGVDMECIDG
jgi:hypothetical protein